ncbi:JAB domain-containing protein [Sandaracinobacteroides saxicola]|uniref:DNA repair protein RadC n=1 Tax=Sandaracinobacteroides saxicola TaxID=2759707 RepID=A0A7G5IJD8_9SPHN|nr:DNA repair protein RadC [Sandaracinobacteroides saxicola]QMW23480.1 DNA repair protein RadC [Sandaracinobacteroides saxicola]
MHAEALSQGARGTAPARAVRLDDVRDEQLLTGLLSMLVGAPRARSVAGGLLGERGSIAAVLATSDERLAQLGADPQCLGALRLVREITRSVLSRRTVERPTITDSSAIVDLLHAEMAHLPFEQFRVLFLDARHRLLRIETLARGSVRSASVHPSEVARRALELGASAVVLVHNHPSGDPEPSRQDQIVTQRMAAALATLDIDLYDHLVIAPGGHVSFRARGLL